jgi:hypothetical protein
MNVSSAIAIHNTCFGFCGGGVCGLTLNSWIEKSDMNSVMLTLNRFPWCNICHDRYKINLGRYNMLRGHRVARTEVHRLCLVTHLGAVKISLNNGLIFGWPLLFSKSCTTKFG